MKKFTNILCIILATCALALYVLPMKHNGRIARIPTSEVLADDEVVYGTYMGISGNEPQLSTDNSWANKCAFITASAIHGDDTYHYASSYYNDPRCYYLAHDTTKLFSGAMSLTDFTSWWGSETFAPFTSFSFPSSGTEEQIVNSICSGLAAGYGIVCVEWYGDGGEGHIWGLLGVTLNVTQGYDGPSYSWDYRAVNSAASPYPHPLISKKDQTLDDLMDMFVDVQLSYLCQ